MEVDFAFLADSADATNGKLYVMGGAFDTLWTPQVPTTYPRLAFIIRLLLNAAELGRPHKLEVVIMDEDGKHTATVGGDLNVGRSPDLPKGWQQAFLGVLNFAGLKFDKFGDYSFNVMVNNSSLKQVRLRVAQRVQLQAQS